MKKFRKRIEELKLKGSKKAVKELYNDIEEVWFKIKRSNDMDTVRHKDTTSMSLLYDEACELLVSKSA